MPDKDKFGPSELEKAGQALFGNQWQSDLTRALKLKDSRRICQFMSEDRSIPPGIWNDLIAILKERKGLIDKVLSQLEKDTSQ